MPGCAGFGVRDPLVLVVALADCQMGRKEGDTPERARRLWAGFGWR